MLVLPWLLEREYRRHRVLDAELPMTHAKWLASLDKCLEQESDEPKHGRTVRAAIHPTELATWACRESHEVNERARSHYAALMLRTANARRRAGRDKAAASAIETPHSGAIWRRGSRRQNELM